WPAASGSPRRTFPASSPARSCRATIPFLSWFVSSTATSSWSRAPSSPSCSRSSAIMRGPIRAKATTAPSTPTTPTKRATRIRAMKFDPKKLNALAVRLHGDQIGVINRLAGDRQIFAFEQSYIDDPQRPTLSLSFKGRTGGLVTALRPVPRRVPPFFSNLLPEGHLREYLAKLADVNPEREFFLLAVLGADLPGALVITPLESDAGEDDGHHDDADRDDDRHREAVMRFSLAGVQLKFSAVTEASGGLTVPAGGMGGSWIVKLPSARFARVPENEYAMLE